MSAAIRERSVGISIVELHFPVLGGRIPADHGYELSGAISRILDSHLPEDVAVAPINGPIRMACAIQLGPDSRLVLRLSSERIAAMLVLAGADLAIGDASIVLGTPRVRAIRPAPGLYSRLVTIKGFTEPAPFLEAARRQMDTLGITGDLSIPEVRGGPHRGKPCRRVVRVKGKSVVGFALAVNGLTDHDSIVLQAHGLGGRRHMGCGFFIPVGVMEETR